MKQILDTVEKKMNKVLDNLDANLRTIRTGRANANMLERVSVEYYGSPTPINQISSIQVVEGRQLVVKPYDRSILKEIDHAIGAANLGLVPQNDGDVIRINVPALTEDMKKDAQEKIQKMTDDHVKKIDTMVKEKSDEIMSV